jgi:hypothetical protein
MYAKTGLFTSNPCGTGQRHPEKDIRAAFLRKQSDKHGFIRLENMMARTIPRKAN